MRDGQVKVQAAKAAVKVTGTKWCSQHGGYAPADTGRFIDTKQGQRWRCASCAKKAGATVPRMAT